MVGDVSRDGQTVLSNIVSFVAAKPSWSSPSLSVVTAERSWWTSSVLAAKLP